MDEKKILVISLVRDLTDNTLLIVRKKNEIYRKDTDAFPSDFMPIGENAVQTAVRVTYERTGITIKNPKEMARIKLEETKRDYKEVLFILSTEFSGSLHPADNTDVAWKNEEEIYKSDSLEYVLRNVFSGKYVSAVYDYAEGVFTSIEGVFTSVE